MICSVCKVKLKVFDTRQSSDTTRWRIYRCPKCKKKYYSDEVMVVENDVRLNIERTQPTEGSESERSTSER